MLSYKPYDLPLGRRHGLLLGSVGPRPICFASTIDEQGRPNLAPFSFFNVFSAHPPLMVFSPARSGRDNSEKDTLINARHVPQVVINVVNYDMVQQTSLASTAYEAGVNEFSKAGLTPIPSQMVKPFRVAESPVQFECKVKQIVELGNEGGAGNLIFCEVVMMHFDEKIFDEKQHIDPWLIDQVARMGSNYYCRAKEGLFEVEKPVSRMGIGVDSLPEAIRNSDVLTGNHLGILGNTEELPQPDKSAPIHQNAAVQSALEIVDADDRIRAIHQLAAEMIDEGELENAWQILLHSEYR